MPSVMRIPEKQLAREIERIANAGIRSVMTFGISHHTDDTGSDTEEDGLVARMSRICKANRAGDDRHVRHLLLRIHLAHGHCGVLCEHGVDNDATLANLGKQATYRGGGWSRFLLRPPRRRWTSRAIRRALDAAAPMQQ